ncbi:hypothetical protein VPNG_00164 [Cytospora leucostoma]|uniref:Uncharacterized protein n=1 Tax=Cytospora leucostoma TaxID=1230097 RepID=A0A423XPE4_9PEZI|nr:hypothetical protein VPNG_00164 [Cytospora leucostoma]
MCCCWEWKPRYFCTWCRAPLYWHPRPGRPQPCTSSRLTGGGELGNCVQGGRAVPVESERVYSGCCADCARLVAGGMVPAHYRDVRRPLEDEGWDGYRKKKKSDVNHPRKCVIL